MESRVKKYHIENLDNETTSYTSSRSDRNAKLYREVYGKYDDLDNLPIEDNTDEIDMDKLKELLLSYKQKKEDTEIKENLNILEQRKRNIDEQRVYDINKILEKAKYENSKLKETTSNDNKPDLHFLSSLESSELSLKDIKRASKEYIPDQPVTVSDEELEEKLSMTRELKYQNLIQMESEPDVGGFRQDLSTKELSLDLFEDLKPTGNTIVTKPIKEKENDVEIKQIESDFRSSDTSDIDVIKNHENTGENDFFTNSYHFSENDFADDDFYDQKKKGGLFKILLLILAIAVFVGVILYFVGTYGLGI